MRVLCPPKTGRGLPMTGDKPVTTSKYSIRLLDPLVEVFDDIAARLDTTRTARIEQHMLSDVRLHGTPDEIAAVEQALARSEEHTSELQSRENLVCRLLLEKN